MAINLTARTVDRLKPTPQQRDYWDAAITGLGLRVTPSGAKSWTVRYRVGRRLRRSTIGRYPTLSLADARAQARAALRDVALGRDPAQAKRDARAAHTFGQLAARYLAEYAAPRKRSWKEDRRLLESKVLPPWRHRAARDIRRRDVRELVEAVARGGAPISANRVRALLHTVFAFAVASEVVDHNPVTGVPRPGVERQRDRVLFEDEIRKFWTALDREPPAMAAIFRLRLITAQRGGEIAAMRWQDLDLENGWWIIPASDSKNRLAHRVPLTGPALTIITALRATARESTGYVVAGARSKKKRSKAANAFGIPDFRGHDLRRTAASLMASDGVSRLVISKVLNHVERGVTAVYDRHSYDAEKRTALETWARRLSAILENRPAAAVVPMRRA